MIATAHSEAHFAQSKLVAQHLHSGQSRTAFCTATGDMSFQEAVGDSATFLNTFEACQPVSIANYLGRSGCSLGSLTCPPRSHTASLWLDLTGDGFASIV